MMSDKKMINVKINQGELQGTVENLLSGNTYASFKGIPYAKPPIGKLRYKAPQSPDNWIGIRDASKHGKSCHQTFFDDNQFKLECSEDCLYLNVYTPNTKRRKFPVMVWFHGGAFLSGSGDHCYFGPEYLLEEDVVVVTANYRLEVFGFLCLDTPDIPGNAGMKDQVAVLRWVKDNIEYFGGDAGNVTIFGESAGAASVTYHIFSPMSEGLFHKVIAQSGCCLNEWTLSHGKSTGLKVAKALGKDTQDIKELTDFFVNIPSDKLIAVTHKITTEEENCRGLKISLCPTVEKVYDNQEAFLLKTPLELLAEGKYHKVPIILGYNNKEGLMMTVNVEKSAKKIFESLKVRIPEIICKAVETEKLREIENKIKHFYFENTITVDDILSSLADMETDITFSYHIMYLCELLSKLNKEPVYLYRFCIDGVLNIPKKMMGLGDRKGTCHADDLMYLFYSKIDVAKESIEWKTVQRLCKMWTNFAKISNPTPKIDDIIKTKWKPVSINEMNYLNIDSEMTQEINPDKERYNFWNKIYESLGESIEKYCIK